MCISVSQGILIDSLQALVYADRCSISLSIDSMEIPELEIRCHNRSPNSFCTDLMNLSVNGTHLPVGFGNY